jgi:hypothetical protein
VTRHAFLQRVAPSEVSDGDASLFACNALHLKKSRMVTRHVSPATRCTRQMLAAETRAQRTLPRRPNVDKPKQNNASDQQHPKLEVNIRD